MEKMTGLSRAQTRLITEYLPDEGRTSPCWRELLRFTRL
jgi:hypothetical protein